MTFREFFARRGYDLDAGSIPMLRRLFVESFRERGFHRFWRVWNPAYGWLLWHLYVLLGGRDRPALATVTVFVCCGFFLHDLPLSLLAGRWHCAVTVAFTLYALVTLAFARTGLAARTDTWSAPVAVTVNVSLLALGLALGVAADYGLGRV
jgi:hypothetical protein